ncbi:MAG: LysR substrate-binding domain-containing protein [Paracoccaceae bacterium]
MDRPPPPLNFIRSFECAARHLSFTKAAQELGYTQAAISTHVRALEKYIGRELFVRNARSIELTEMGEAFLPTLRQGLAQIDNATNAIATTSRDRSVVIACPMSLAENWLPSCVGDFSRRHPDVEVVIHGTVWENPEDHIADIVISVNRSDEIPPGARKLWNETLSLVCDPALAARITRGADLVDIPKISVAGRQEYWALVAGAAGIAALDIESSIKTNASNISLELAAHGLGATIALTSLCGTYIARGLLEEPLLTRPESPWAYYVINRRGSRSAMSNRLFEHILSAGRETEGGFRQDQVPGSR